MTGPALGSQVSVGLCAGCRLPVVGQVVLHGAERDADGGDVLHGLGHGGFEGRSSGCEKDEDLEPLDHEKEERQTCCVWFVKT